MSLPLRINNMLKEVEKTSNPTEKQIINWRSFIRRHTFDMMQCASAENELSKLLKAKCNLKDKR